jgi:hypothetical protein
LTNPLIGVCLGVTIALLANVLFTPNPARIPALRVIMRSLPGLVLYFLLWTTMSYLVFMLIMYTTGLQGDIHPIVFLLITITLGACLPQVHRLRGQLSRFNKRPLSRFPLLLLLSLDDSTAGYLTRIIYREERKVCDEILVDEKNSLAIDKLYEFHLGYIVTSLATRYKPQERWKAIKFFEVRNRAVKLNVLIRYFGYHNLLSCIDSFLNAQPKNHLDEIRTNRPVSFAIYVSVPEKEMVEKLAADIDRFSRSIGIEVSVDGEPLAGSWLKYLFGRTRGSLTTKEVNELLEKAQQAIELAALGKPQASVDKNQADAASAIVRSLDGIPTAVCQVGSILVVKLTRQSGPQILVRTLSTLQVKYLEENQHLLRQPEAILQQVLSIGSPE